MTQTLELCPACKSQYVRKKLDGTFRCIACSLTGKIEELKLMDRLIQRGVVK